MRRRPLAVLALTAALAAAPAPGRASTPRVQPWLPPDADSLVVWAAQAKAAFQQNQGDSTGGANFRPYDLVGFMSRRLIGSLGMANMNQAPIIKTVLDSLGLDTEVRVDPRHPTFALVMVRNPYRRTAHAVGFLCWYKERDLRLQAVDFVGGFDPQMRVWWSGNPEWPWEWGILEHSPGATGRASFSLLKLTPAGTSWVVWQFDAEGLDLSGNANMTWADINGDEKPELIVWTAASADSLVRNCDRCPAVLVELTLVERPTGFTIMDTRLVPSPMTTFVRFARMLVDGDAAGAARLLKDPRKVREALANGWASRKNQEAWRVLYAEPNTAWPGWLMVRHYGAKAHDWKVDFEPYQGRWVIRGWLPRDDETTPGYVKPDTTHRAAPAGGRRRAAVGRH
jgi:hypothetical protein